MKLFGEVKCSDRLPKKSDWYLTSRGRRWFFGDTFYMSESPEWGNGDHQLKLDNHFWLEPCELPTEEERLPIICICGSTRFADYHAIARWLFEQSGEVICTMINYLPAEYAKSEFGEGVNDHFGEVSGRKDILDELHKRKIDISDAVFVVDIDGYIGESTQSEMDYAARKNIPIYKWTECEPSYVTNLLKEER